MSFDSKRALIIDDSGVERMIMAKILQSMKYSVVEAADGRTGLEAVAKSGPFSLIAVDWNMPNLDGLAFVKAVRAHSANAKTRVVMVTSELDLAKVRTALAAGADEYLMKPCNRESMQLKLKMLGLEA